jgi:cellobiose phosphorylase
MNSSPTYNVVFSASRAEFNNGVGKLGLQTLICVSTENNLEIRRLHITNNSNRTRTFKIFTYIEIVLSDYHADLSHPAYNKMFIETQLDHDLHAIICHRKPTSGSIGPYVFHSINVHDHLSKKVSFETERENFIGRNRDLSNPAAIENNIPFSNSFGVSLDPIMSISEEIQLDPDEDIWIDLFLGVADSIEETKNIIRHHRNRHISDRIFDLGWNSEQLILRKKMITENDLRIFQKLASNLIYNILDLRADPNTMLKNERAQDGLWALNISGDNPIMLIFIRDLKNIEIIKKSVQSIIIFMEKV